MASAASVALDDALYTSSSDITGITNISGSFSYTLNFDVAAMQSILGQKENGAVRPMLAIADNNYDMGLAMALNNTGFVGTYNYNSSEMTNLTMSGSKAENRQPMTTNGSTPATNAFANAETNSLNSKFDELTGLAVTFSHTNKTSSSLYITLTFSDGTKSELYGINTGFKWSNGVGKLNNLYINEDYITDVYLFNSAVDKNNAFDLNAAAIVPEPATATLSLLALAGLAMRRRRK
ncbi:MAG: PEP-CTERM sorting domain-containing protein [Akkermansia sp.]|nr:PEP-CTERM sorting domain-containing protein [Akkermansia sp.]